MQTAVAKNRLFPGPEVQVNVNSSEHIVVVGYAHDFDFSYFIYSEAFETWLKQDIKLLKVLYPLSYAKLEKLALKEIMRNAINTDYDEPTFG